MLLQRPKRKEARMRIDGVNSIYLLFYLAMKAAADHRTVPVDGSQRSVGILSGWFGSFEPMFFLIGRKKWLT